jgi:hypothetical protein
MKYLCSQICGHLEVLKHLYSVGCNPNIPNHDGHTPVPEEARLEVANTLFNWL